MWTIQSYTIYVFIYLFGQGSQWFQRRYVNELGEVDRAGKLQKFSSAHEIYILVKELDNQQIKMNGYMMQY